MGHVVSKDLYHQVGKKLDGLEYRSPMNEHLYGILKEIFTPTEAEVFCRMPYSMSTKSRISRIMKMDEGELETILSKMSSKGLVIDLYVNGENQYMPSPMLIGIFEFTMMRTGGDVDFKRLSKLFHGYFEDLFRANLNNAEMVTPIRALPHEQAIHNGQYTEILDYEKARSIVEQSSKFAIGLCSCRHEKLHLDEKKCDLKLETCSTYGIAAESFIRNNLAKEVSKTEALENIAHSVENRLVIMADNVKTNVCFTCHCCSCCCNALAGISRFGYANCVVTSNFLAHIDTAKCDLCGICVDACPVDAIKTEKDDGMDKPQIDTDFCLGCGVCSFSCGTGALHLVKREKRVLHPENTFERILLQCLERGTLQNQLFDNQNNITMKFMSGLVGGFLRLSPVKKALMSDLLRSRFLSMMRMGVKLQGKGWLIEL